MKKFIIVSLFAFVPFVASAHTHTWVAPICTVDTVAAPTGGGGLIYGSSPLAPGWDASKHSNYVPYNGTTCPFNQGCMLPQ